MLQGHAVTLTFNVATQMLRATRRLNMGIIFVKYFYNRLQITKLWAGHNFAAMSRYDLDLQDRDPNAARDGRLNMGDISVK